MIAVRCCGGPLDDVEVPIPDGVTSFVVSFSKPYDVAGLKVCAVRYCDIGNGVFYFQAVPDDYEGDADLMLMDRETLVAETKRLRAAIRQHRDSSGHDLCWYVPELWATLPEGYAPKPEIPPFCEFIQNCAKYRESLEKK